MPLEFEWDLRKARSNLVKHGVAFEEASTIFGDSLSLTILIRNIRTWNGATSQWVQRLTANCSLSFIQTEAIISASSAQDARADENVSFMKKGSNKSARKPMRDEYDFSQGERGKYARRYAQGANVVALEPDVAKVFSDSKSVNVSLRRIIRKQTPALAK
jgi:uncharacterized DUF497 family protein